MRAVLFESFGGPVSVATVPDPTPTPDGVVIRVAATGLCRSDWHAWMGHDDGVALPHVPGHELAGTVVAVGSAVRSWRPDDRVTVPFVCACGRCRECAAGRHQVCPNQTQPGFTRWGSFAEYVAIENAEVNLIALPAATPFPVAAGLGCRVATAYRAVVTQGRAAPGEWVAVFGCGGLGLAAVAIAASAGASVIAVDPSQEALRLARVHGAAFTLTDPSAIPDHTGGGAHLAIEAAGTPAACAAAVTSLRRHGRHVQAGLLPVDPVFPMGRVIAYELSVLGSHGMAAHAYPELLALLDRGGIRLPDLITTVISLDSAPAALMAMGSVPGITIIEPNRVGP